MGRSSGDALADGFGEVRLGFSFRRALTDAAGNRRAFGGVEAVSVPIDGDEKLHGRW